MADDYSMSKPAFVKELDQDRMDDALAKVKAAIRSGVRAGGWDVDVIDDSAGTTKHYLDLEIEGNPYRLILEDQA